MLALRVLLFCASFGHLLAALTCDKIDVCSCEMSDGSGIISLWALDGKSGPEFTDIPDQEHYGYKFLYNPCTGFDQGSGCKNTNVCENYGGSHYYAIGSSNTTFTVDSRGLVVVHYGKVTQGGYTRLAALTLVCAMQIKSADFGLGFSETQRPPSKSEYTATLKSKCACPNECLYMYSSKTLKGRLSRL